MNEISRPPSGYAIEAAITAWHAARQRLLLEDPSLEDDEAALVELLGPEEGDVQDVLARLIRGAVHASLMADAAQKRIDTMIGRLERYMGRAATMRATAFAIMDSVGLKKLELEDATASIRSGNPKVTITDLDALPGIYVRETVKREADKVTLLAVLKSLKPDETIPGAELSNGVPSLAIRTR